MRHIWLRRRGAVAGLTLALAVGPLTTAAAAPEDSPDPPFATVADPAAARDQALNLHQGLAIGALVGMVATGVIGQTMAWQREAGTDVEGWRAVHVLSG